jgi:hypothetical protein
MTGRCLPGGLHFFRALRASRTRNSFILRYVDYSLILNPKNLIQKKILSSFLSESIAVSVFLRFLLPESGNETL